MAIVLTVESVIWKLPMQVIAQLTIFPSVANFQKLKLETGDVVMLNAT